MARPNWEYVRVDVLLPDNPKLDGLSPSAKWTLIELWCYCGQHLTDGFVRTARWTRFGETRDRKAILAAGLADPVPGGYQMHDYLEHQRSRAEVEAIRARRSLAGRASAEARAKARANAQHDVQQDVEHPVEQDVEPDPVDKRRVGVELASAPRFPGVRSAKSTEGHSGDQRSSDACDPQHPVEQNGNKTSTEAEAEAELLVADVSSHPSLGNAHGVDLTDLVITEIRSTTGRDVTPEWAEGIASAILKGRQPDDPAAYARAVIRNEKHPRERFLPAAASHPSARTPAEAAFAAGIVPNGRRADPQAVAAIAAQARQALRKGPA